MIIGHLNSVARQDLDSGVSPLASRGYGQMLFDPTLEGLRPTIAGLGLGVLVPTVDGLQGTVDVA
jgi:hypothetical protein